MIHTTGYIQVIEEPSIAEMREELVFAGQVDRGFAELPNEEIRRFWRQRHSALKRASIMAGCRSLESRK